VFLQCKQGSIISSADWKLDPEELASKFNSNTKMIIINTPNNPLGKVNSVYSGDYSSVIARQHYTRQR